MDPTTTKMAARLALSLARSKTGRRLVVAVAVVWALLMATVLFLPFYLASGGGTSAMNRAFSCGLSDAVAGRGTMPRPATTTPGTGAGSPAGSSPAEVAAASSGSIHDQQVRNARLVERGVRKAGGSGRAVYVTLVAAVGESDLVNVGYGDLAGPDSRGVLQQRNNWGSLKQRMDPAWAAGAFLLGPHQAGRGGLLTVAGWESMPVTLAIHAVQINADPQHYARFETRARQLGEDAGVNFDAPAGAAPGPTSTDPASTDCVAGTTGNPAAAGIPRIGTGPCPLDDLYARGHRPGRTCNAALAFLQHQMESGSTVWYRRCLALVMQSYGYTGGAATAFQAAQQAAADGRLSTNRTKIPRGAVLYWDGRPTGNTAGHVAVADGEGYIYSNDVTGPGRVGRVPWDFPETSWGQTFLGWSAPYFPTGSGGGG